VYRFVHPSHLFIINFSLGDLFIAEMPPEFHKKIIRYFGKDILLHTKLKAEGEDITTSRDVPLVHVMSEVMLMKVPDFVRHSVLEWGMIPFIDSCNIYSC